MEASVVVCQPLRPLRPCDPENLPKIQKTRTKKRAHGACAVRSFLSMASVYMWWL